MENKFLFLTTPDNVTVNTTTPPGKTLCHVNEPYTYVFTAALILLSVVGTIENSFVIIAMCKYKILRTPTIVLIGALSTIDLLTSSTVIPLFVVNILSPSVPWHKSNLILMTVIVALSLLTAVYISVDRFAHVYHLQAYNMTLKKSIVGLLTCWISPFIVFSLIRGLVYWIYGREAGRVAGRVTAAVLITLCIAAMVGAYFGILVLLRQHTKKASDALRSNYVQNQSRASKTSLIIVAGVVLMNAPSLFYTIILSTGAETTTWFCTITLITLLGSSALNPFVYCLRIPMIKKHILLLMKPRKKEDDGVEETRLRTMSESNATRFGSLSVEFNQSVTSGTNKDSLKLLRRNADLAETYAV